MPNRISQTFPRFCNTPLPTLVSQYLISGYAVVFTTLNYKIEGFGLDFHLAIARDIVSVNSVYKTSLSVFRFGTNAITG